MKTALRMIARSLPLLVAALFVSSCDDRRDGAYHTASEMRQRSAPVAGHNEPMLAPADSAGASGAPARYDISGEGYNRIVENAFTQAATTPLSTFSIDVDRASYSNVRRFLEDDMLPPAGAVRVEEMINYFSYDYPRPTSDVPFTVATEIARCPWNSEHQLLLVGVQGKEIETKLMPPSNLVFLVDVSGSMDEPDKLPLVKESLRMLVGTLRKEDRVAIVVYAGAAGLVLPSTSGADRDEIEDAIDDLKAGGSTAGGEGIELAYAIAKENFMKSGNNRVILATDGDFNVGISDQAGLVRLIEEKRNSGIYLTVLGFGAGNLQDGQMEQIADHGNGQYAYIDGMEEARKVFRRELSGTLHAIAKDVKIQVEFNPANVRSYRLIGYENRALAARDFTDDRKDAGELGSGHSVTALYEIEPTTAPPTESATGGTPLRYRSSSPAPGGTHTGELVLVKLRYKLPREETSREIRGVVPVPRSLDQVSGNIALAASVAEFGMLLRGGSEHMDGYTFDQALELAEQADKDESREETRELIELIRAARRLATGT